MVFPRQSSVLGERYIVWRPAIDSILRECAQTQAVHFAIRPEAFDEMFARLNKIERLRRICAVLFLNSSVDMTRQMLSQRVRITVIFKAPTGEKAEADVQSGKINQSVTFIG
jgi:hypothetical protein